jgi:hypothetical protein
MFTAHKGTAISVFYTGKPTKGVPEVVDCAVRIVIGRPRTPEVVDCAVRIVIGRPRTRRYAQRQGTQDLYRFALPRWRTLRPVWGIKYGTLRLVLGCSGRPARYSALLYIVQGVGS